MKTASIINGLVLAGGKSIRMGQDKGLIDWHGKEQRYYIADLLIEFCNDVFLSCRKEQQEEIDSNYKTIPDAFEGSGPYGGILSAFQHNSDSAWLVVACDLPLLDRETLYYLIQNRDSAAVATTFKSPFDGLPEPLVTIWEPRSYTLLQSFRSAGYTCPRKVLINSEVCILKAQHPDVLLNVNTPEESKRARNMIQQKMIPGNT
jgi:molybdopterin-guanine dinucleotide biosynthesis protein A